MDFSVYLENLKLDSFTPDEVTGLLGDAFQRFQSHIRCVHVTITEINEPTGGVDKQCRCVLQLKRSPPIVIEDRDEGVHSLLCRVATLATYSLSQRFDRPTTSYRPRRRGAPQQVLAKPSELNEQDESTTTGA